MKQMIAIVACGLFCFTSGLYLGVQKANDRVAELGEKYKETDNKVAVFTDLNDPKTVQFYVSELNKIVDNMHRLGKIIDKGEEVDLEELPKGTYLRKDPKLPNLKIQVKRRRGKIIKSDFS